MNFKEKYEKEITPNMIKNLGYKNSMAVPRVKKIVVNAGVGKFKDAKQLEEIKKNLESIAGQKISERGAKKAIASFKTREGQVIGYATTLRGKRMYDFFEKMVLSAIPRVRDFRGIDAKSVDQAGNLTIGFKENILFPEMIGEDVKTIFGFEVTVVTDAKNQKEALELFKLFGIPFKKNG